MPVRIIAKTKVSRRLKLLSFVTDSFLPLHPSLPNSHEDVSPSCTFRRHDLRRTCAKLCWKDLTSSRLRLRIVSIRLLPV
jgi:hypothetical protein